MIFRLLSRTTLATVAALAATLGAHAQEDAGFPAATGDPSVLPAGAKLERVFDGGCILTEGVAAGHDGMMYFSDITFTRFCKDADDRYLQAGNIWKYNPQTGETTIFRSPSGMSNGIKFDADGNMIAALGADYGGRMLLKTDMQSGKSYILTGLFEGKPYNALNDISIDEQGRIYFTDPRYLGHEPIFQPGYAAYRLDTDGTVHRIATNCGKCNGILVSPDQKRLYIVSNDDGWFDGPRLHEGDAAPIPSAHLLQVFDLAADGSISNRRVLINYSEAREPACSGPDGMIADVEGNLYVAERCEHRPGIAVYTPDGEELAFIPTGEELPTNVGFGRGEDSNLLYVTSGHSLYRIRMAKNGYQLP